MDVPGSILQIAPARKPLIRRTGMGILAVLVFIIALAGLWRRLTARRDLRLQGGKAGGGASGNAPDEPLSSGLSSLKRRCDSAESRLWLADAERLCTEFLCRKLGVDHPAHVRFEAALEQYLARNSSAGPGDPEIAAAWSKLRDLFHEARYAGTRREPHELREALRHITVCLQPSSLPPRSLQPNSSNNKSSTHKSSNPSLEYQGERQS